MDQKRFDDLTRALAGTSSRRAALAAATALAAGGALQDDAGGKRRRRCRRACAPGQTCVRGACVCDDGGTPCGAACCAVGQRCQGGSCVAPPPECVGFGQVCKNVGVPCCDGFVCGSGQGGEGDVACYVPAGGPCETTAACVYDSACTDGTCVAIPRPTPTPAPTCASTFPATGDADANGAALRAVLKQADPSGPVEIVLAAGEYAMPNCGWRFAQPLTIRACPGAAVTWRPNANYIGTEPFFQAVGASVTLDGIAFVGLGIDFSTGISSSARDASLQHVETTLRNCSVRGFVTGVLVKQTTLAIEGGDYRGNEVSLIREGPGLSPTCTGSPLAGACCIRGDLAAACGCTSNCP